MDYRIVYEIAKKEIYEHIRTKRLMITTIIFGIIVVLLSYYLGAVDKPEPNVGVSMIISITSLFIPILAIILSYDMIVGERVRHSLILLLSKPVDRESVLLGKFFASLIIVSFIYIITMSVGFGIFFALLKKSFNIAGCYAIIGIVILVSACCIALALFFSIITKTIATSVVLSIIMFIFVLPLISQIGVIYVMTKETGNVTVSFGEPPTGVNLSAPAKILYMFDPRNSISDATAIFLFDRISILTLPQIIGGLVVFWVIFFGMSVYIFRKLDVGWSK
jgi:ABC-type transport system involved in multi-copper enzyme maturation permease subunit